MTEIEMELQKLRRENKRLQLENAELKEMHYCDQSQIVYQRRQIDFLMGALDEANIAIKRKTGSEVVMSYG